MTVEELCAKCPKIEYTRLMNAQWRFYYQKEMADLEYTLKMKYISTKLKVLNAAAYVLTCVCIGYAAHQVQNFLNGG